MIARIGCVILAAGESRRFHRKNKLLSPYRGVPLLQHAVDKAAQSQALSCTVVLGASADLLQYVEGRRCAAVYNDAWQEGIASSIRAGLRCHDLDEACIFMLADMPFVQTGDLDRLIALHRAEREAIIALRWPQAWGSPMLFPHRDFGALHRLRGDRGAQGYARTHPRRVGFVQALASRAGEDIDTVADYERLVRVS